jgi:hypothetical protein
MSGVFRKRSVLEDKIRRLEQELSAVGESIRTLSDEVDLPEDIEHRPRHPLQAKTTAPHLEEQPAQVKSKTDQHPLSQGPTHNLDGEAPVSKDERFVSYLMTSGFQGGGRPLRQERRIQRNRALILVVIAVLVLIWLLQRG